jgi:beta-1,4-mannosyl-glycoprotein beta-1,4-N-acetylglucosaminyltransferase
MAKVIDCFTFYNELKILDLRLAELKDVVDYFILVEATKTFSGENKRLYFDEIKDNYKDYPIIHVIVDDMPESGDAWGRERHQRKSIIRGLKNISLNDQDILILSDADEIPDSKSVKGIAEKGLSGCAILQMDLYYYNLHCKFNIKWIFPKIFNYAKLKEVGDFQAIRSCSCNMKIPKGGWHFSYFGDINFIINKIESFSHQEFNNEKYKNREKIQKCIDEKTSLYEKVQTLDIDPNENDYLPKNWKMLV